MSFLDRFSGIQKHVVLGVGGVFLGAWLDGKRDAHFAERDAVLRHYVELHPDDFPPTRKFCVSFFRLRTKGELLFQLASNTPMSWNPGHQFVEERFSYKLGLTCFL